MLTTLSSPMIVKKPDVEADGLYNVSQTANALNVDRHTVTRYARQGRIRFLPRCGVKVTTGADIIRCWQGLHIIK